MVADLLILNRRMPRSLAACASDLVRYLDNLAHASGKRGPAHRKAVAMSTRLAQGDMATIFASGLHEFIGEFLAENNALGHAIQEQYLFL